MNTTPIPQRRHFTDAPFHRWIESTLGTLHKIGLHSNEQLVIDESVHNKYIPALKNSLLYAVLASPGIIISDIQAAQFILAVIASVTGIAWFTVSLKDVKQKFASFGVELSGNMLQAFLTTVFIIGIVSVYGVVRTPLTGSILSIVPVQASVASPSLISSGFRFVLYATSIAVIVNILLNLVKATIQFDANDAMLTGSMDASRRYFERALSSLRSTAQLLRSERKLESANFIIASALKHYWVHLMEIEIPVHDDLKNQVLDLAKQTNKSQLEIDQQVIAILRHILKTYQPLVQESAAYTYKYNFAVHALDVLEESYGKDAGPSQALADNTIADTLEAIADFVEQFQDLLEEQVHH